MTRRVFASLSLVAFAGLSAMVVQAAPVNATGHWNVQLTNGAELYTGVVTFNQVGQTVIGHAGKTTINGTMVSDTKMNATWNGPHGAGWITLYFSANGNTFQGTWGFNGRKSNGSFVGKRVMSSMMAPAPKSTK